MLGLNKPPEDPPEFDHIAAQAELNHLRQLLFSFEAKMDKGPSKGGPFRGRRGSRSAHSTPDPRLGNQSESPSSSTSHPLDTSLALNPNDAALLAQISAEANSSQPSISYDDLQSLSRTLQGMQGNYPPALPGFPGYFPQRPQMTQAQMNPPLPPSGAFPWPIPPFYPPLSNPYGPTPSFYPDRITLPYDASQLPILPNFQPVGSGSNDLTAQAHTVPAHSGSSSPIEGAEQLEEAGAAGAEDKRRRNTAASARFRVKKKHRTLNLERSVSDLTGRAEDLEREVADLRRENSWLKEIVMLKGRRFTSTSKPQEGDTIEDDDGANPDGDGSNPDVAESSDEEGDSGDKKRKGKAKAKAKGKGKGKGKGKE